MSEEKIDERTRAEDILLGSLGFGEGAKIISIELTATGYRGVGEFEDGERFEFESEDEIDNLQRWALGIVVKGLKTGR